MVEAIIEVRILRDGNLNPTGMYYNLSGLPVRTWFAIYIDNVQYARFRTNNQGVLEGTLSPIPSEYYDYLISLGGFKYTIRDFTITSGIIAGISDIVEDTDNEGLPNIGFHEIDLRYD
jgi:hypothetical protein